MIGQVQTPDSLCFSYHVAAGHGLAQPFPLEMIVLGCWEDMRRTIHGIFPPVIKHGHEISTIWSHDFCRKPSFFHSYSIPIPFYAH